MGSFMIPPSTAPAASAGQAREAGGETLETHCGDSVDAIWGNGPAHVMAEVPKRTRHRCHSVDMS